MTQDLQKIRTRSRRGESFWRRTLLAQKNSALSQLEFCRRNDLPISTFHAWRRRLREDSDEPDASVEFVEIQAATSIACEPAREGFELVFPGGLRLKLPSEIQGQDLVEVLWALEVSGSC